MRNEDLKRLGQDAMSRLEKHNRKMAKKKRRIRK